MSLRARLFHIAIVFSLIAGLLTAVISAPTGARAQDDGEFDAYPPSVTVQGEQFILDRLVPLDRADFERIEREANLSVYARSAEPPYDAVYGLISGRSRAGMARYLPTHAGDQAATCLAEAIDVGPLTGGDATYAFAGIETDIPADELEQIAEADGQPVYADPDTEQPAPELFLENDDGLLRFLIMNEEGLPSALPESVPFAGQTYEFEADMTEQVDSDTLGKMGCVGPFPALVETETATAPFTQLYLLVAGRYLSFQATGPAEDDTIGEAADETDGNLGEIPADDAETDTGDATPGGEEPADTDTGEDQNGAGLPIQIGEDLGNGGQPDGLPRELTVGDARYLFDRVVPLRRQDLNRIAQDGPVIVYARSGEGPFDALYVSIPDRSEDELARYLPEWLDAPEMACPAEAVEIGQLDSGAAFYAFAGIETDLTGDLLEEIAQSGGEPVYADPGAAQPQPELFLTDPNGLLRFLALGEDGRPAMFAESLAFAGAQYAFAGDVTDSVNQADLTKVGCAGPFPAYTAPEQAEGDFTDLYVLVSGRLFQFSGEGAPVDEASPTDIPAELPTETAVPTDTEAPTETEVPTEEPTGTPVPTDTEVPTDVPTETEEATEEPTETTVPEEETASETAVPEETATVADEAESPTEAPAETATSVPREPEEIAQSVDLPATLEVNNTTYVFNQINVDIDIETLVQVEVIEVQGVELTIYARQQVQGVAPELFCVNPDGEVVGQYVLAAGAQPEPPAELPDTISIENNVYIFNEVEIDIDINVLIQIQVIIINNIELTVYEEPNVPGRPPRIFVVGPNGEVAGQYVEVIYVVTYQDTTAAATAIPSNQCSGPIGPINDAGLPAYLPNRIQWGGVAYTFEGTQPAGEAGNLTRLGCIGPFEVVSSDAEPRSQLLYLRVTSDGQASQLVYRFEAATTFVVEVGPSGNPRTIQIDEDEEGQYRLRQTWLPYIYGSQTVILFAEDPEDSSPDVFFAVNVGSSVVGDSIGEYRVPGEQTEPSEAMVTAAEEAGLNPDLTVAGQRYLLVNIYRPIGTTEDGFVTLFAVRGESEGVSSFLLGRDKRRTELFIYDRVTSSGG
jgi:hypothetical protein